MNEKLIDDLDDAVGFPAKPKKYFKTKEEIKRRLEAFNWYNRHYHLPKEMKHLEAGVDWKKSIREFNRDQEQKLEDDING